MDKQMVSFVVETENGVVKRIGRSVIAVPEVILQTAGIYNRKI